MIQLGRVSMAFVTGCPDLQAYWSCIHKPVEKVNPVSLLQISKGFQQRPSLRLERMLSMQKSKGPPRRGKELIERLTTYSYSCFQFLSSPVEFRRICAETYRTYSFPAPDKGARSGLVTSIKDIKLLKVINEKANYRKQRLYEND